MLKMARKLKIIFYKIFFNVECEYIDLKCLKDFNDKRLKRRFRKRDI